jgi:hypothetical protein
VEKHLEKPCQWAPKSIHAKPGHAGRHQPPSGLSLASTSILPPRSWTVDLSAFDDDDGGRRKGKNCFFYIYFSLIFEN